MIIIRCDYLAVMEARTTRLPVWIEPRKNKIFRDICAAQDLPSSQVVRKPIRQHFIEHATEQQRCFWLSAHTTRPEKWRALKGYRPRVSQLSHRTRARAEQSLVWHVAFFNRMQSYVRV